MCMCLYVKEKIVNIYRESPKEFYASIEQVGLQVVWHRDVEVTNEWWPSH